MVQAQPEPIGQSMVFNGKTQRISTFLADPQFQRLSEWRVDFRVHDLAQAPTQQDLVTIAGYLLYIPANSQKLYFINYLEQPGNSSCAIDFAGRTDMLVRLQRRWDPVAQNWPYSFEMWNTVGGGYTLLNCGAGAKPTVSMATTNFNDRFTIGGGPYGGSNTRWAKGTFGFFRIHSSAKSLRTQPPRNEPDGDDLLLRLEFEGDPFDWGPLGQEIAVDGELAFAMSPRYKPYAETSISEYSANAGDTVALDASASQATAGDGAIASYQWELLRGPGTAALSGTDTARASIQASDFGTYHLKLTITDRAGEQAVKIVKVGVVPTGANGLVDFTKIPNGERIEFLLGPQIRDGVTPWKWHDQMRRERGDYFGKAQPPAPGSVPLAGTIKVSNGSKIVDGVGTDFLAEFPDCNKATNQTFLSIHYPAEGGGTGIATYGIASCQSKTRLTLSDGYKTTLGTDAGLTFGKSTLQNEEYWVERLNYYDQTLVQYGNYYRTGLDTYLEYARSMGDAWWKYARINEGRVNAVDAERNLVPRRIGMTGMMLRALDGRPEMWAFMKAYLDQAWTVWQDRTAFDRNYNYKTTDEFYYGIREPAYVQLYSANLAKVHPDAAVRAEYKAKVLDMALQLWVRTQYPDGSWRWNASPGSDDWGIYGRGKGEQPFLVGLGIEAMIATYQLTENKQVLNTILKATDHVYSATGYSKSCRGTYYVAFTNICMTGCNWCDGINCTKCTAESTPVNLIRETRAENNLNIHAMGFAYYITRESRYLTAGDDMFSATFGANAGPGSDGLMGLADTDSKQFNQSFRTASKYLGWRAMATR